MPKGKKENKGPESKKTEETLVPIKVKKELRDKIKIIATVKKITMQELVEEGIKEVLEKNGNLIAEIQRYLTS